MAPLRSPLPCTKALLAGGNSGMAWTTTDPSPTPDATRFDGTGADVTDREDPGDRRRRATRLAVTGSLANLCQFHTTLPA